MNLVILFGPPAVGKMTVGQELASLTGYRLLYNTLVNDVVMEVFPRGHPAFSTLAPEFHARLIEEAAVHDVDLISTAAWAIGLESDDRLMADRVARAERHGAKVYFVELEAPFEVRLERNRHEHRVRHKPRQQSTLTDEVMRHIDENYTLNSGPDWQRPPNYLRLDTTALGPREAALAICDHFGFERTV